jgi:arylsulfatase A-like enzyme
MHRITRRRFVKAGAAGVGGAALLGAGAALGVGRERGRVAQAGERPNLVVISLDTVRADHVGAYAGDGIRIPGTAARTPSLDALARESLRFTRARPEALPTGPTRRAMHTGNRVFPMRGWEPDSDSPRIYGWQHIREAETTWHEVLRAAGYRTAVVTDNTWMLKPSWTPFLRSFDDAVAIRWQEYQRLSRPSAIRRARRIDMDRYLAPGLRRLPRERVETYEGVVRRYLANQGPRRREQDWSVAKVFTQAMRWVDRRPQGQPFALLVDSYDPHEPWDPPRRYVDLYDDPDYRGVEPISPLYGRDDYLSDRLARRMRALYKGELTLADRWLGHFLEHLDARGLASQTVVVVLSDHGHSLADRGYVGKVPAQMHSEMVDVPLLIRHPEGRGAGRTTDFLAQLHDLAPTVLGALGVPAPVEMAGIDLTPLLDGAAPARGRDVQTAGYNDYVWASDGRWVLISDNRLREPRLYDRESDPRERRNLAARRREDVRRLWQAVLRDAGGEPPPRYRNGRPVSEDAYETEGGG